MFIGGSCHELIGRLIYWQAERCASDKVCERDSESDAAAVLTHVRETCGMLIVASAMVKID